MEESDAGIFRPALCSQKCVNGEAGILLCRQSTCCLWCRNLHPSLWEQIPLSDLHEPETMKILYQGQKSLSRFGKDNKKAALSDGKRKSPAGFSRNDTERVREVTKRLASGTH